MLDRFRALWVREPARVIAACVAAVVFIAARFGVVVDAQDLGTALLVVLPILLGGEVTRAQVPPATQPLDAPPVRDYVDGGSV